MADDLTQQILPFSIRNTIEHDFEGMRIAFNNRETLLHNESSIVVFALQ